MALVPAALKRRLLAKANFGGGALVNLVAFAVQPTAYLKRMSIVRGVMGPSTAWTVIAVFVYGSSTFKRMVSKQPEVVDVSRLGSERFMTLTTAKPITRRRARRLRKQGVDVPTLKDQKAYGKLWAAQADAAKRAS